MQKGRRGGARQSTASRVEAARAEVRRTTDEYKAALRALVPLYEKQRAGAIERVSRLDCLYAEGVVSRRELDQALAAVGAADRALEDVDRRTSEADFTLAEVEAERAEDVRLRAAGASSMRSLGTGHWAIAEIGQVESFFASRFGHALPVSAFGQSEIHNRLGYDHRNAVDVAVRPDSPEGQALIAYLQSRGIPFLAFRSAIPNVATGAHIHIGLPSHRF